MIAARLFRDGIGDTVRRHDRQPRRGIRERPSRDRYDDTQQLARIEAPTFLLWGDRDALFSRTDQDCFMAALPAARLPVYEETGHCPNWERPERVAADIGTFILHG